MGQTVDFYFDIKSRYSYLASTQISKLEEDTGCRVEWRPIRFTEIMRLRGTDPFDGRPVSGQYVASYRQGDAESWAEFYGVPYIEPDFDIYDSRILDGACTAAGTLGALAPFTHAMFRAVFVDGGPVDEVRCADMAEAVGLSRKMFLGAFANPATGNRLSATVNRAHRRGVFGVPTFLADQRLFWGNDRMVLLRHHLMKGGG